MRHYGTVRDVLGHGIKPAIQINDSFHDYKNNISLPKKQEFGVHIANFYFLYISFGYS
jgi:hypothetical protein